jgi:flagellar basal body-associated protein FliL
MSAETQPPEKKKTPLWIPIVIGLLVVGFIGSLFDSGEDETAVEQETVTEEKAAEEPAVEEEPAEPTSFATLAESACP